MRRRFSGSRKSSASWRQRGAGREELAAEMADVLAWLVTLANIRGIELEEAFLQKYGRGCPNCNAVPCTCDPAEKP